MTLPWSKLLGDLWCSSCNGVWDFLCPFDAHLNAPTWKVVALDLYVDIAVSRVENIRAT